MQSQLGPSVEFLKNAYQSNAEYEGYSILMPSLTAYPGEEWDRLNECMR